MKAELLWARRLCNRRGWPVIDVTRRSIEETAATVLQLMEAWHERAQGRRRRDAKAVMLQRRRASGWSWPALRALARALLAAAGLSVRGQAGRDR